MTTSTPSPGSVLTRAQWRCECRGECGRPASHLDPQQSRCLARHQYPDPTTGHAVRLLVQPVGRHGIQAICPTCLDQHRLPAPPQPGQLAGQTSILDVLPEAGAS